MVCVPSLPASLNFPIYQGATFNYVLTWYADDTPVDLTGFTASMVIRSGEVVIAELEDGSGITLGGTAGTITLNISATDTAAFTPTTADYDLKLTSGGGVVTALLAGLVSIRGGISG